MKKLLAQIGTGGLVLGAFVVGSILSQINWLKVVDSAWQAIPLSAEWVEEEHEPVVAPLTVIQNEATPTETLPPYTPLPSVTPMRTLLAPPTFEPPTQTPAPSNTPSPSPTVMLVTTVVIPGLNGLETPTPSTTPGCEPRKDWKLTYEVQPNDALASIADKYGTYVGELVEGNCLTDANMIVVGQQLRVPGEAHPNVPVVDCSMGFEVLTPVNGAYGINGFGQLTFNWRGPRAQRNLIRVYRPDGTVWERVVDLRQNETIDLAKELPAEGTYQWRVYPLDMNFQQLPNCPESALWTFHKTISPTATPTMSPSINPGS